MQKGNLHSSTAAPVSAEDTGIVGEPPALSRWSVATLQAFFDQAPFYAGILSPDGRVTEAGRTALEAGGYTRAEVLGRLFWETPWWRGSPKSQSLIRTAVEGCRSGRKFEAVLAYLAADATRCAASP